MELGFRAASSVQLGYENVHILYKLYKVFGERCRNSDSVCSALACGQIGGIECGHSRQGFLGFTCVCGNTDLGVDRAIGMDRYRQFHAGAGVFI